ncbi:acyl-CoA thioesterase [Ruegeria sp. 2012CJ41-6]|uniref:Acyl-CoA thioesterase n=2 Tax=Ruegeria spongiae TaxID=2942209 RepID=A0ABT0Q8V4_9RHOB|nr:acyl-CoA thioesterase [Ruegeria spongiae]
MQFACRQKVLFRHCDPAGIVFYPRYFEMLNDCVETFFDECIGWPFETVHKEAAVPTASISVDFTTPSHHGDLLEFNLMVVRLGTASMALEFRATCGEELRLKGGSTLVYVGPGGRPQPWPRTVRDAMADKKWGTQ